MEPIAIIGIGCRFPGESAVTSDIDTPSALWDFLLRKGDAYTNFPADRINVDAWYHPKQGRPGSFYTQGGCFLKKDPRLFDSSMFGISPQETRTLDPAHRKLLETVYEAFESSGTPLSKVKGSSTGCFIGNFNYDHQLMQFRDSDFPEPYGMTGGSITLLSNRISYTFDLRGPSLTVDTACSSSMYALHLACSAIESGECTAAVVGGSNLILTPECQIFSAALGSVSKTSKCHTFDIAADGYARAEGIGVLYIKKLSCAIQDGDPIRAVIRATSANANGRTGGITHPDPSGQERAIRRAYERAGNLNPTSTSYVECHGTGTPVGDPLEVEAIGRVFALDRTAQNPLLIGSIKSNMGHCEAASGIAGVIKAVLAIENKIIPPIRALNQINPNVNLCEGRIHIVQENMSWPECSVRRASVNSFGYGGANAHTVLEETDALAFGLSGLTAKHRASAQDYENLSFKCSTDATDLFAPKSTPSLSSSPTSSIFNEKPPDVAISRSETTSKRYFLLPISAHNEPTMRENIKELVLKIGQWDLPDLAYTLSCRRSAFTARSFIVANSEQVQEAALRPEIFVSQRAMPVRDLRLGFVFTGQGAQWPGMGKELMDTFHVYLESIRYLDKVLCQLVDRPNWSLETELGRASPEVSRVYEASLSQPLVTAVQIALIDLLASWNILPAATLGHSSGEIAAAYAAGHISSAEAILIAYARGRAVARNDRAGAMLAVSMTINAIEPLLLRHSQVSIACYNSPENLTLSGDRDQVRAIKTELDSQGVFNRMLHTGDNAYHSEHMAGIGPSYERELRRMTDSLDRQHLRLQPRAIFTSSVTNSIHVPSPTHPTYWRQNLESPVLFSQSMATMTNFCTLDFVIELGPHAALRGPIQQIMRSEHVVSAAEYLPTILRSQDGAKCVLETVGKLWSKGFDADFMALSDAYRADERSGKRVIVDLPKYQWQYGEINHVENRWTKEWRLKTHLHHDLLGSRHQGSNRNEPMWRNVLKTVHIPWLKDHRIGSDIVFPAAGYILMATEAALQMAELLGTPRSQTGSCIVKKLSLDSALTIPDNDRGVEVLFNLRKTRLAQHSFKFTVTSVVEVNNDYVFTEHAHGSVTVSLRVSHPRTLSECSFSPTPVSESSWYGTFSRVGLNYGPTFQGLSHVSVSKTGHQSSYMLQTDKLNNLIIEEPTYLIHPTTLDAAIQLTIIAAHGGRRTTCNSAFIPRSLAEFTISTSETHPGTIHAWAKSSFSASGDLAANVSIFDQSGNPLVSMNGLELVRAENIVPQSLLLGSHPFSRVVWKPDIWSLNTKKCRELFPADRRSTTDTSSPPPMDRLALNLLLQLHNRHPEIFIHPPEELGLKRFFTWMTSTVDKARGDLVAGGMDVSMETDTERTRTIVAMRQDLAAAHGPESRFLCHMFDSYPDIFSGKISGIQAAVHNNLLSDMYEHMQLYRGGSESLARILELLSHDRPGLDIFEIGGGTGSAAREILGRLRGKSDFRGYNSYTFTDVTPSFLAAAQNSFEQYRGVQYTAFDMEKPVSEQRIEKMYDVVIASNVIHVTTDMLKTLTNVRRLLKPGGKLVLFELVRPTVTWVALLGSFPGFWNGDHDLDCPRTEGPFLTLEMWKDVLPRCGFSGIDIALDQFAEYKDAAVILTTAVELTPSISSLHPRDQMITVVYRGVPSDFCAGFATYAQTLGLLVDLVALHDIHDISTCHVVCLAEIDRSLFLDCTEEEWAGVKDILLHAASTVWVTRGDLLDGTRPEHAMIGGIISAVHTEHSGRKVSTLDLDSHGSSLEHDFETILSVNTKIMNYTPGDDFIFRSKSGILHTSRLIDDESLNQAEKLGSPQDGDISCIPDSQVRDTHDDSVLPVNLADSEVEVTVKAYDSRGKMNGALSNDECPIIGMSGIVRSIGASVTTSKPGDSVFGLCSRIKGGTVRAHESFCYPLKPNQSFDEAAYSCVAACTALFGLEDAARLQSGETLFVSTSDFSIKLIACSLAADLGASVYTVVASEEEKASLLELVRSLASQNVLVDASQSGQEQMSQITQNQGLDVVLSDAVDHMFESHWQLLAPLGRYVRFSIDPIFRNDNIAAVDSSKCILYTAFSLSQISKARPTLIRRLLARVDDRRIVRGLPVDKLKDKALHKRNSSASQSDSGSFRKTTETSTLQTTNLSIDDGQKKPKDKPSSMVVRRMEFDPNSAYLLVGCLGGLGRSFSKWMTFKGARHLVYLSRSGTSNAITADFVSQLQRDGIRVQVVRGDVSNPEDVETAIAATKGCLKGVVQAPLSLKDSPLDTMTLDNFNVTMRPRVAGTLNLHRATKDSSLDFFLMLSSWTETLGSASQANYMASSAFMNAFALHRQKQNLPATSLSLGHMLDIGIVSENPNYQEHLMRMGLYGNDESEFLQFCEMALSSSCSGTKDPDHTSLGQGHLLAGLEPAGLAANSSRYPLESMHWFGDPRFAHLLRATERFKRDSLGSVIAHDSKIEIADDDLSEQLVVRIKKRVARCLYLTADDVDVNTPITTYGIDSMVAAQIRNWLLNALGADVSLFFLLHPTLTIAKLTAEVERCVNEKNGGTLLADGGVFSQ